MSTRDLTARIENLAVGTIAAVALLSLLAYSQHQDAAADQAAHAHVEQQRKGEVAK